MFHPIDHNNIKNILIKAFIVYFRPASRPKFLLLVISSNLSHSPRYIIQQLTTISYNSSKRVVRLSVSEIIITVSIHKYKERKQNFGQVERAYVRLYKPGQEAEGQGEFVYDLTEDFSACASIEFVRLYRHKGEWKIQATGIGHHGGLEELVEKYT